MTGATVAMQMVDVAFFSQPPRRQRGERTQSENRRAGRARALLGAVRRELARATDDSAAAHIPQIARRYPY